MSKFENSETYKGTQHFDTIVIGSGMGGMTASASLAKLGQKVLVLEQHYVPGGFTHTFSRKGFTWDVGVHCLGEMSPSHMTGKIFRWLSNSKVEMEPFGSVYEKYFYPGGFEIEFPDSKAQFKINLENAFPEEKESIKKYFELVSREKKRAPIYFGLRLLPTWASASLFKLLSSTLLSGWVKTTREVLDGITTNEKLKTVLVGQWGYYGSTPSHSSFAIQALVTGHYLRGGYYPVGGSSVIAESILENVVESGGTVLTRARVAKLLMEKNKAVGVELDSGVQFFAKQIISAVGAKNTVMNLIPERLKTSAWSQKIQNVPNSPSYICLNLGFEGDIGSLGASRANHWIVLDWNSEVSEWDVMDPNSNAAIYYLSFPSLKDPKHNGGPNQKHTGELVTFVPWNIFDKWKESKRGQRSADYTELKQDIERRMLELLKQRYPKLMEKCVFYELSTPLSALFYAEAPQGAIYGLDSSPARYSNSALRPQTPIKNFYLTGVDICTPGIAGAMMSGLLTAAVIEPKAKKSLMGFLRKKSKDKSLRAQHHGEIEFQNQ